MAKLSMKKKTKSKKSLHGSVKRQTSQKKLKIRKSSNRSKKTGTKKTKKGGANLERIKSRQESFLYFDRLGPMNILMHKMQKEQVTADKLEKFIDDHGGADLFINATEKGDPQKYTPIEFVFFVLMRSPMTASDPNRCLNYIKVLLKKNVNLSDRLVKAAEAELSGDGGGGAFRPSNNQQLFEEAKKDAAEAIVKKTSESGSVNRNQ